MAALKEGKTYPLRVENWSSDGAGVARHEGRAVFVKGGLRGELCRVYIEKVGRSAVWGHTVEVLEPSPQRLSPDCPYYALCGGCQTRHMTYAAELEFKRQKVEDALRRIGGADLPVSVIYGSDYTERYRNKAQFPAAPGPDGPRVGFYRQGTHTVTDVADCLLQSEAAARLRSAAKGWMADCGISAYDERTGEGLVRHMYVRTNRAGESLFCLLVNGTNVSRETLLVDALRAAEPGLVGVVLGVNKKRNNVILGDSYRTLWGRDYLMDELCGLSFRLSVPSFYQVNSPQAERLYNLALDFAALTGEETALDLYCGIGTITLCLARRVKRAIGAEVVPEAIADARENAKRNGIENAEFFCGDASEVAARLAAQGVRPDVVTVDPPRKGLAEDVVSTIAEMAPSRVVYVSCDCATLARDVKRFAPLGYAPQKAVAVDLFPRTSHVETVCLLTRTKEI